MITYAVLLHGFYIVRREEMCIWKPGFVGRLVEKCVHFVLYTHRISIQQEGKRGGKEALLPSN